MPMEIHTRQGVPYKHGRQLGGWTTTSARVTTDRSPAGGGFRPLNGLDCPCGCPGACQCGPRCARCTRTGGVQGLGAISPTLVREAKPGESQVLDVSVYVMSQGPLDPLRLASAMGGTMTALGYVIAKPTVKAYPLTWAWEYDGPSKVYQAFVTGKSSGPFVRAAEGVGPTSTGTPTQEDAQRLPSVGTVITFSSVKLPVNADVNQLLGELRAAKVTATRGSNATDSGQLELRLRAVKKPRIGLWASLAAAGFYLLEQDRAKFGGGPVF